MQKLLQSKRGAFIILWALLLPFVLAIIGLIIDLGIAYSHRSDLQHVADAAALAGASQFESPKITDPVEIGRYEQRARELAQNYIDVNLPNNIVLSNPPNLYITKPEGKTKRMNVDFHETSPTFFLRIFNVNNININVHSAAIGANQPNIFDYALITTDEGPFDLFGGGAPAGSIYQGDIYTNSKRLSINQGSQTRITSDRLLGNVFCPNSLPYDFEPVNTHLKEKFYKDAETIDMGYNSTTKKYANKDIQNRIDDLIRNTGRTIDNNTNDGNFTFPSDRIYVKGDFNISPANMGGMNDFIRHASSGREIVIIADGNITINDAGTIPANANVTLCSISGNITFNGGVTGGAKFNCLAPIGTVNMNCSNIDMDGYIICKKYIVGGCGNLRHINLDDHGDVIKEILRLVE